MTKSKWLNSLLHALKRRTEQIITRISSNPLFMKITAKVKKNRTLRLLALVEQEQLRMGIEGVLNHKLRSLLTTLGIIFGVAAVISMLAIGEGARRKTLSQIQSLGLQNIIIERQELSDDESNEQDAVDLNFGDVQAVKKIISSAQAVVPVIERDFTASYKSRSEDIVLTGTLPEYFRLMNLKTADGGYFSMMDNESYQRVCILGPDAARALFLVENSLGKMIKIGSIWFRVVGVLQHQPVSTAGTKQVDLNNHIFAPINTVNIRFDRAVDESELEQIIVQLKKDSPVIEISQIIDQILMRRHNNIRNFNLIVPEQLLRQSEETQRIFNIVMGAIAGISLLVGGIGIMNIMLASVLERTREIGIRRSMGATKKNIMQQFLIEAVILSLLGGLIGIFIGYALAMGITLFSEWETAVSLWSVILSFGVSSGVGVLFGYYPAKKAAELNPIDALRYE
jgi:putative ABC transport system permease protein